MLSLSLVLIAWRNHLFFIELISAVNYGENLPGNNPGKNFQET